MVDEVEGLVEEQFGGASPAEGFSRAGVQLPSHGIERLLAEVGEVRALREVLAQQAVGVFVDGALPWAVRVGEVDFDPGAGGDLLVAGHFLALVVGHREAALLVDAFEHADEAVDHGISSQPLESGQGDEQRGALYQGADGRGIALADDHVAFPVSRDDALFTTQVTIALFHGNTLTYAPCCTSD